MTNATFYGSETYLIQGPFQVTVGAVAPGELAAVSYTLWVNIQTGGGSNNSSGAHPAPVSVTVGASLVTGGAPLNTTLSAYIDGGSAPFVVTWSLPGSNATTNLTGLMVAVSYSSSGWYPATAFVYNTTSSFGQVLVGYGGVWLYVSGGNGSSGNGPGNGSGNGSDHRSGLTPITGHLAGSGLTAALVAEGLIGAAAAAGAVVGALGGFALGRRRHPQRRAERGATDRGPPR